MAVPAKLIICIILFLSNSIYGLASPFLPTLLDELGVASTWTGVIFAIYAVAGAITSPIVGAVIDSCGHAKLLAFGTILMAIACTCFGFGKYIDDSNTNVIIMAICVRIVQGKSLFNCW